VACSWQNFGSTMLQQGLNWPCLVSWVRSKVVQLSFEGGDANHILHFYTDIL